MTTPATPPTLSTLPTYQLQLVYRSTCSWCSCSRGAEIPQMPRISSCLTVAAVKHLLSWFIPSHQSTTLISAVTLFIASRYRVFLGIQRFYLATLGCSRVVFAFRFCPFQFSPNQKRKVPITGLDSWTLLVVPWPYKRVAFLFANSATVARVIDLSSIFSQSIIPLICHTTAKPPDRTVNPSRAVVVSCTYHMAFRQWRLHIQT